MSLPRLAAVAALAVLAACTGPAVPNPMVGQARYLCCNLFYEKTKINDGNYQRGTKLAFGTRVEVTEVKKGSVTFRPAGHPPITILLRYGKRVLGIDEYMNRLFLAEDPHTRLRRVTSRTPKKERGVAEQINQAIDGAQVVDGMTRDEVLMSVGYPPAHRTPSLEAPTWTYWENSFANFFVTFEGDRVTRVER